MTTTIEKLTIATIISLTSLALLTPSVAQAASVSETGANAMIASSCTNMLNEAGYPEYAANAENELHAIFEVKWNYTKAEVVEYRESFIAFDEITSMTMGKIEFFGTYCARYIA